MLRRFGASVFFIGFWLGAHGIAQDFLTSRLTARDLFYAKPEPPRVPTDAQIKRTPTPRIDGPAPQHVESTQAAYAGLRFRVLKVISDGEMDVDQDAVFHSGDQIRLQIQANQRGYIYVVQHAASGDWGLLIPNDSRSAPQPIEPMQLVMLPPNGDYIDFHDPAGTERLYIIFTTAADIPEWRLVEFASSRLHDSAAQKAFESALRSDLRSRDLKIGKTSADDRNRGQRATYVVNVDQTAGNRVIAEIVLRHE